jgi:hypothetical protein
MFGARTLSVILVALVLAVSVGCTRDSAKGINSGKDIPKPAPKAN